MKWRRSKQCLTQRHGRRKRRGARPCARLNTLARAQIREVVANDFSAAAVESITRNIEHNSVQQKVTASHADARCVMRLSLLLSSCFLPPPSLSSLLLLFLLLALPPPARCGTPRVQPAHTLCPRVCSMLMYQCRDVEKRFHVVDLDPYGSAAPFLDGAVQ
eukprot:1616078-Rhodomonas_salina.2